MIEFLSENFVPFMFIGLFCFLLTGFPVAFSLAATGLTFGFIGMEFGLFPDVLFQALPLRMLGIMSNETLLAIPFFTLMGIILERSRMAEELLETVAQVFGPVRGGLAVAVIMVGALLAATTGVVAAAVISMGLISLPIMLRYGYNRTIATGAITASGTLAQALPPSLVLIVLADQLGRSVGDCASLGDFTFAGLFKAHIASDPEPRSWIEASAPSLLPRMTQIFEAESSGGGYGIGDVLPETLTPFFHHMRDTHHEFLKTSRLALAEGEKWCALDLGDGPVPMRALKYCEVSRRHIRTEILGLSNSDRAAVENVLGPLGVLDAYLLPPLSAEPAA